MSTVQELVGLSGINVEPAAHFYIIRRHRYARLCRAALDLVVLSPGFLEGTTKTFAIKTKPWRVAAPVLTAKLLAVFQGKPVKKPEARGFDNEISHIASIHHEAISSRSPSRGDNFTHSKFRLRNTEALKRT